tara:strand:- start:7720 stop:8094 length:375 start_codon:yes stop_codon:yes gene_type:complete
MVSLGVRADTAQNHPEPDAVHQLRAHHTNHGGSDRYSDYRRILGFSGTTVGAPIASDRLFVTGLTPGYFLGGGHWDTLFRLLSTARLNVGHVQLLQNQNIIDAMHVALQYTLLAILGGCLPGSL